MRVSTAVHGLPTNRANRIVTTSSAEDVGEEMTVNTERFDVIVVGGGPAGATAATFVAMQGHRVLLIERQTFPIYKIGESLLPSTIHGICSMLGVSDEIKAANFVRKLGGTF